MCVWCGGGAAWKHNGSKEGENLYFRIIRAVQKQKKNHFIKLSFLSLELFEPRPREYCSGILKVLGTELKLPVSDQ